MELVNLDTLFEIYPGHDLELNKQQECKEGIRYVSRTRKNNGVSAYIRKIIGLKPAEANTISVALSGSSVLSAFLQEEPYYTSFHVAILKPLTNMTKQELLFYCYCINQNKFKYNFGRQANKTINKLLVPSKNSIPSYVNSTEIKDLSYFKQSYSNKQVALCTDNWKKFKLYDKYFDMKAGTYYPKTAYKKGNTPLISSSSTSNGVTAMTDLEPTFPANTITIGKVCCSSFYQNKPFCATSDCTVLLPKFSMSPYVALFICTILNNENFRWNYGRQIRLNNCMDLVIKLPSTKNKDGIDEPNWELMENYIKTLPYTKEL